VSGRQDQSAGILVGELLADRAKVFDFLQCALGMGQHGLAWFGKAQEPLALANKDFGAQLILEFLDGLAHSRLRGAKRHGDFGQVELMAGGFAQDAQLLQVHGG
jgi:hypothetical protein